MLNRLLIGVLCLSLCGCDALYEPVPPPGPTPPADVDAAECLRVYGAGVADAFDQAADQFEAGEPASKIVRDMGEALKPARVNSFLPLMQRLNDLRPAGDADQAESDAASAKALREWASQLRGDK